MKADRSNKCIEYYDKLSLYNQCVVCMFQTLLLLKGEGMAKEDLVFILKRLLQTDAYLEFLLQLNEADLRTLIACIRDRVDRGK